MSLSYFLSKSNLNFACQYVGEGFKLRGWFNQPDHLRWVDAGSIREDYTSEYTSFFSIKTMQGCYKMSKKHENCQFKLKMMCSNGLFYAMNIFRFSYKRQRNTLNPHI